MRSKNVSFVQGNDSPGKRSKHFSRRHSKQFLQVDSARPNKAQKCLKTLIELNRVRHNLKEARQTAIEYGQLVIETCQHLAEILRRSNISESISDQRDDDAIPRDQVIEALNEKDSVIQTLRDQLQNYHRRSLQEDKPVIVKLVKQCKNRQQQIELLNKKITQLLTILHDKTQKIAELQTGLNKTNRQTLPIQPQKKQADKVQLNKTETLRTNHLARSLSKISNKQTITLQQTCKITSDRLKLQIDSEVIGKINQLINNIALKQIDSMYSQPIVHQRQLSDINTNIHTTTNTRPRRYFDQENKPRCSTARQIAAKALYRGKVPTIDRPPWNPFSFH